MQTDQEENQGQGETPKETEDKTPQEAEEMEVRKMAACKNWAGRGWLQTVLIIFLHLDNYRWE